MFVFSLGISAAFIDSQVLQSPANTCIGFRRRLLAVFKWKSGIYLMVFVDFFYPSCQFFFANPIALISRVLKKHASLSENSLFPLSFTPRSCMTIITSFDHACLAPRSNFLSSFLDMFVFCSFWICILPLRCVYLEVGWRGIRVFFSRRGKSSVLYVEIPGVRRREGSCDLGLPSLLCE